MRTHHFETALVRLSILCCYTNCAAQLIARRLLHSLGILQNPTLCASAAFSDCRDTRNASGSGSPQPLDVPWPRPRPRANPHYRRCRVLDSFCTDDLPASQIMSAYNPYASGHGHPGDGLQQMDVSANGQMVAQGAGMDAMAGHSLDDIVNQNANLMRRQSVPQGFHSHHQHQQPLPQPMDTDDPRRMSMMEFTGTSPTGPLESYQFSLPNSELVDATAYMAASQANPNMQPQRRLSSTAANDMATDNGFGPTSSFMPMMPSTSSYQSPAHLSNLDMDLNSPYINTPMHMSSLGMVWPSSALLTVDSGAFMTYRGIVMPLW